MFNQLPLAPPTRLSSRRFPPAHAPPAPPPWLSGRPSPTHRALPPPTSPPVLAAEFSLCLPASCSPGAGPRRGRAFSPLCALSLGPWPPLGGALPAVRRGKQREGCGGGRAAAPHSGPLGSPESSEPKKAGRILRGHPLPFSPGAAENSWRQLCGGRKGAGVWGRPGRRVWDSEPHSGEGKSREGDPSV